jgi:hypothetical protein
VQGQSLTAFVEGAAGELAHHVLLEWAIARYAQGDRSLGELAEESGLSIEEIMTALAEIGDRDSMAALARLWDHTRDEASEMFRASAESVARLHKDPAFLRRAEGAAAEGQAARTSTNDKS